MPNETQGEAFKNWNKLKPVYFPRWAWEKACRHNPKKYQMNLPTYQGKKVLMT